MSQTTTSKRPLTVLQKNTKKDVIVTLKSGVEYRGKMENVDSYMNLIMTDAEELNQGKSCWEVWKGYCTRKQTYYLSS